MLLPAADRSLKTCIKNEKKVKTFSFLLVPYLIESEDAAVLSPSTQQCPRGITTSREEYLSFRIISPSKPTILLMMCL